MDDITDSLDMSLSNLRELVMDREAWRAAIHTDQQGLSSWNILWASLTDIPLLSSIAALKTLSVFGLVLPYHVCIPQCCFLGPYSHSHLPRAPPREEHRGLLSGLIDWCWLWLLPRSYTKKPELGSQKRNVCGESTG